VKGRHLLAPDQGKKTRTPNVWEIKSSETQSYKWTTKMTSTRRTQGGHKGGAKNQGRRFSCGLEAVNGTGWASKLNLLMAKGVSDSRKQITSLGGENEISKKKSIEDWDLTLKKKGGIYEGNKPFRGGKGHKMKYSIFEHSGYWQEEGQIQVMGESFSKEDKTKKDLRCKQGE